MSQEILPIVTPEGDLVGSATRAICHGGSMLLHPVVHLHVVATDGSILLQKRSMSKDIQPGRWDTAVGGHVDFDEEIYQALLRETREELGLTDINPRFIKQYVFESERERELVNVYTVKCLKDRAFDFDPAEIDEVRFWSEDEILESIEANRQELTPNFIGEYLKIKDLLK